MLHNLFNLPTELQVPAQQTRSHALFISTADP